MTCQEVVKKLKAQSNAKNVVGMARFGISTKNTLGVSMPVLRLMGKEIKKDLKENPKERHQLALGLWQTGIHEARILAGIVDTAELVTAKQMDEWVGDFDSWDVCDQVCMNLFDKTLFAFNKAKEYTQKEQEFVKRTGFVLMAALAVHNKIAKDSEFIKFLPLIKKASTDERNFVKKAVNWALRQIGKRNKVLNQAAIQTSQEIQKQKNKTAKWVASNALSELTSSAVQKRLMNKL
ncbi:MAG: DNA alkylation repair protein [Candidatus Gribaldobacteria bacterium]|nr:DNA alkylation repair protein [Candidatus Gribaldobacteria bacterium]